MNKGKNVVVTGAGRGFGRTVAIMLAKEGARLFISARNAEALAETEAKIRALGHSDVHSCVCDIKDTNSVAEFGDFVESHTNRIDILVNNGAAWLEGLELLEHTDEEVINTISSGGLGTVLITKRFLPLLRNSEAADILNMISICGEVGSEVSPAHASFYAAKHCHAGFAEILSKRLRKEGIRVISFFPPDFNNLDPLTDEWGAIPNDGDVLTSKSLWNCLSFALSQPRDCYIKKFEFEPVIIG